MLRRLDPRTRYRSLDEGFWPSDIPFGKRTVIYGHNGSGKSTLSDLLLEIAAGNSPIDATWEDETRTAHKIVRGGGGPAPSMAVFTKSWVQKNLSQFLDGAGASPIVTLGEEAIEAKEQEQELVKQIEEFRSKAKESEKRAQDHATKAKKLATAAQNAIADQLREFDYARFTKNRYSMPVVEGMLRDYKGDFPDENKHAEALKRLGEGAARRVAEVTSPPAGIAGALANLDVLLADTPTSVALESLAGDHRRQAWAERGVQLHEDLDNCLFCGNAITEERRQRLAKHFDKNWFQIRERAQALFEEVQRAEAEYSGWLKTLPDPSGLIGELRDGYGEHLEAVQREVAARIELLGQLTSVLSAKVEDPGDTSPAPDWTLLKSTVSVAAVQQAISEHNKQADEHAVVTEARYETVLNHIFGSRSGAFRDLEAQGAADRTQGKKAADAADLADRRLTELRQQQFTTSKMAATLTKDLSRVYGKNHLSVTVTPDGKSYSCRRGEEPAQHLSDGERTTLSLLYFLRKLQDETDRSAPAERIVVVDDPSSSLDREALFATHQWLIDTLKDFGPYVVLTHDFNLLRLFLKSQKNRWTESVKKIDRGDTAEMQFPSVSFLEVFTATRDEQRVTKIEELPRMLRNNVSEYAYLFSMVMKGVADATDGGRLFLLPNAARRVLEFYANYRAPHLPNLDQQLRSLIEDEDAADAYRDVYDFCNRYSHGEGTEHVDVLDARAVHAQIRRAMEFLASVDPNHFSRMCKATAVDEAILG
jgi:energy-coupling factor transporter ATP-binding protein EcfA2